MGYRCELMEELESYKQALKNIKSLVESGDEFEPKDLTTIKDICDSALDYWED